MVNRFTDAYEDILSVRVRFVAATDTRWRYAVHQRLTPIGTGPQGQQVWQTTVADAEMVLSQMQVWQGFRLLEDQKHEMVNGLTLLVSHLDKKAFAGGVQRDNSVGLGYQPKTEKLEEGIVLRFSPLLTYDGDALDAAIELSTNVVRRLHATKVLAPREVGPGELTIDVPEVSETRLNKTIKNWPLGQVQVISAGIQPGILQDKGGLFNLRIPARSPPAPRPWSSSTSNSPRESPATGANDRPAQIIEAKARPDRMIRPFCVARGTKAKWANGRRWTTIGPCCSTALAIPSDWQRYGRVGCNPTPRQNPGISWP